jgi:hypothetical protein
MGQAMKRNLTDRTLKSLRPTKPGTHTDVWDLGFPGFGVRVSDTGRRTFVLTARYPGSKNPTRRKLGVYDRVSLEEAREKARGWIKLIAKGIDPESAEEAARHAALRQENTFLAVTEEFFKRHLSKTRQFKKAEGVIRREFVSRWAARPITEITRRDVLAVVDGLVDAGKPYQAHNVLGYARRIFNWAISRGVYGLENSPCDRMRPKEIIGAKKARTRVLNEDELRALWKASEAMGYPYGALFQMLALTRPISSFRRGFPKVFSLVMSCRYRMRRQEFWKVCHVSLKAIICSRQAMAYDQSSAGSPKPSTRLM